MPFKLADIDEQYRKDSNLRREDVLTLLDWTLDQPHLPKITELQAILFLHSCYYNMSSAKTAIDNYFTMRTLYPDLFDCASEETVRRTLLSSGLTSKQSTVCDDVPHSFFSLIKVLPKRTPEGYVVLLLRLTDCGAEQCVDHTKLINMVLTLHLHQHGVADGLLLLFDTKGCALGHVTRGNLMTLKQLLHYLQDAAPVRIKGLHYLNAGAVTERMILLLKPFLKKEIVNMMKFHSESAESLYKHIPRYCLPKEYGGYGPTLQSLLDDTISEMLDNLDFFKWHDTQKVDEKKRMEKPTVTNYVISVMQGLFKKLEVD